MKKGERERGGLTIAHGAEVIIELRDDGDDTIGDGGGDGTGYILNEKGIGQEEVWEGGLGLKVSAFIVLFEDFTHGQGIEFLEALDGDEFFDHLDKVDVGITGSGKAK